MIYCKLLEHNCGVAISEPLYNYVIKVRDRLKEIAFPQKRDGLFPAMTTRSGKRLIKRDCVPAKMGQAVPCNDLFRAFCRWCKEDTFYEDQSSAIKLYPIPIAAE
jgi:hypothetical protein